MAFFKLAFVFSALFFHGICANPGEFELKATEDFAQEQLDKDPATETERIIGGADAADGQFPWTVALSLNGVFICTASIISSNTILTAAHCVIINGKKQPVDKFVGTVGRVDRTSRSATNLTFSTLITHPEFNARTFANDIAIFQTTLPFLYSDTINKVSIAKSDTPINKYRNATIMGWGRNSRFNPFSLPKILQFKENAVLPHLTCQARYFAQVSNSMICADGFGSGVCNGDSGGPFVHISSEQEPTQIGITSFVRAFPGCGSLIISPAVFTRVSAYEKWIRSVAGITDISSA